MKELILKVKNTSQAELSGILKKYDVEFISQNLPKAGAYSLLAEVRAILLAGICEKDYKYLEKALDLINKSEHFT